MSNTLLAWFIFVTGLAVLLQAGILLALFLAMRKTSKKVEALAEEVKNKVLPTAEHAQSLIIDLRPRIETVIDNVSVSAVPEPPTVWLLAVALIAGGLRCGRPRIKVG